MVCVAGFEPTTYGFQNRHSPKLSYTQFLVGKVGLEPTRPVGQRILSPVRLPISPQSLMSAYSKNRKGGQALTCLLICGIHLFEQRLYRYIMKVCNYCQTEKQETEFASSRKYKDGLKPVCKQCEAQRKKDYNKAYREAHKDKLIEYCRQWRAEGNKVNRSAESRQKHLDREKKRWAEDETYRERQKQLKKEARQKDPEKFKQKNKEWREANLKHARDYARTYTQIKRATDPEWHKRELTNKTVWRHRNWHYEKFGRGGWVRSATDDNLVDQKEIARLHAWQQDHCYFCNKPMKKVTLEHILPRERGGPSISQNLSLTCENCNYGRQERLYGLEWLPAEVEPVEDKIYLTPYTVVEALQAQGINCKKINDQFWEVSYGNKSKILYILSSFFGSDRNPASRHGRFAKFLQSQSEKPIILFDREWYLRQGACINMVKSKLGIAEKTYGARELDFVAVSQSDADAFLTEHHVMGKKIAAVRIGLHDGQRLFGLGLFTDKGEVWECDRLSFRGHVPGGMSKIMKELWRSYGRKPIRSFVDSRYADGSGHESIGFENVGMSGESYQWVLPDRMQHSRYLSNDNKMARSLLYFNPKVSREENIKANGIFKIWTPKRHITLLRP